MKKAIKEIQIHKDNGNYKSVKIIFGPHFFADIFFDSNNKLKFALGYTHHGFIADATEVNGELEKIIEDVRNTHPDKKID